MAISINVKIRLFIVRRWLVSLSSAAQSVHGRSSMRRQLLSRSLVHIDRLLAPRSPGLDSGTLAMTSAAAPDPQLINPASCTSIEGGTPSSPRALRLPAIPAVLSGRLLTAVIRNLSSTP